MLKIDLLAQMFFSLTLEQKLKRCFVLKEICVLAISDFALTLDIDPTVQIIVPEPAEY